MIMQEQAQDVITFCFTSGVVKFCGTLKSWHQITVLAMHSKLLLGTDAYGIALCS